VFYVIYGMCKKEHEKGYNVYTLFKSVRNGEGERGRRRRKEKIEGIERKRSERKKKCIMYLKLIIIF